MRATTAAGAAAAGTTAGTAATLLVLAKAPEPGRVKTRLCPPASAEEAADVAAAALLDTLDATAAVPGGRTLVAFTGRLAGAARRVELRRALVRAGGIRQRGDGLGERIAAAHADAAARHPGVPTLQVGMDTPQLDVLLLVECVDRLRGADAVLGPARDGGWWALGLRDPRGAGPVADVPMSRADTGERTLHALRTAGLRVALLPELTDVDTAEDARSVAADVPGSRFARAVERVEALRAASFGDAR
ncbi:TIGR04282 family arsenosugar biosynthesis glycosyltransferase [Pseudonocardia halophobica]|uniref:TIGR04282 family arsenosugar biosynthesis glycosyltransferase n=1 Tax=Pseudonocardia halophobica TaxID=29401 RepID=UPI003D9294C9